LFVHKIRAGNGNIVITIINIIAS